MQAEAEQRLDRRDRRGAEPGRERAVGVHLDHHVEQLVGDDGGGERGGELVADDQVLEAVLILAQPAIPPSSIN